jgi:anti-sigma factor RsiW
MRCEEVLNQLAAFSSGELPADVRQVVQAHLAECPACRAALARVDALAGVLASTQTPPVPAGFAARVTAAARQRREAEPLVAWNPLRWWRLVPAPMHAAAAAVLVIGLAVGLLMGWTTLLARQAPPAQAAAPADPLDAYNLDYLGDAPSGSLADSYLALISGRNGEGQ